MRKPVAAWTAELGRLIAQRRGAHGQDWLAERMAALRPPKRSGKTSQTPGGQRSRGKQAVTWLEKGYNVTLDTLDTALRALDVRLEYRIVDVKALPQDADAPGEPRSPMKAEAPQMVYSDDPVFRKITAAYELVPEAKRERFVELVRKALRTVEDEVEHEGKTANRRTG